MCNNTLSVDLIFNLINAKLASIIILSTNSGLLNGKRTSTQVLGVENKT